MTAFDLIAKYCWLFLIAVSFMNVPAIRRSAAVRIERDPALAAGYENLLRRYLVVSNIPWIAMGLACTVGGVPSVWLFFRPRDGNPYVLSWFALVILLWIYEIYWIFLGGGAEALVKHPGAYRMSLSKAWQVKALVLLCTAGGIAGAAMMWNSTDGSSFLR